MSEWRLFTHLQTSPTIIHHPLNEYPAKVDVQIRVTKGSQQHIFSGFGSCQRDDDDSNPYGGIVYIYNDREVKLYTPVISNTPSTNTNGVFAFTGKEPNVVHVKLTCNICLVNTLKVEMGWGDSKSSLVKFSMSTLRRSLQELLECINLCSIPFQPIKP